MTLTYGRSTPPVQPQRPANASHRILVVEDDEDIRAIYIEALAGKGHHVDAAADGQAGWEELQHGNYDLLITDGEMPRMSGLELVQKVRSSNRPIAILIVSGSLTSEDLEGDPSTRDVIFLPKPFSPGELVKAVDRVLCGNAPTRLH
jgi:CheY-like chemotaxis protein